MTGPAAGRQAEAVQTALTEPLPAIQTNGTWSKTCSACVGQGGLARPQLSGHAEQVRRLGPACTACARPRRAQRGLSPTWAVLRAVALLLLAELRLEKDDLACPGDNGMFAKADWRLTTLGAARSQEAFLNHCSNCGFRTSGAAVEWSARLHIPGAPAQAPAAAKAGAPAPAL